MRKGNRQKVRLVVWFPHGLCTYSALVLAWLYGVKCDPNRVLHISLRMYSDPDALASMNSTWWARVNYGRIVCVVQPL